MKNILSTIIFGLLILAVGFVAGWYVLSKEEVSVPDLRIVYDTLFVDNADTVYVAKQAQILYIPDTTVITETEYVTIEPVPAQQDTSNNYIAHTEIEVGDYRIGIQYNTQSQLFSFQYHKFREIIARIEMPSIPAIKFGAQATLYSGKKSMLGLNVLVGFPRIFDKLYLNLGAISDASVGIGLTYIF